LPIRIPANNLPRLPLPVAEAPSERWSMDFMADKLSNGKRFRHDEENIRALT